MSASSSRDPGARPGAEELRSVVIREAATPDTIDVRRSDRPLQVAAPSDGVGTTPQSARSMRILFLSHYFPPEVNAPAVRTFDHCRQWARAGAKVTVVTCVPNHPMGKVYPGHKNGLWQVTTVDGIRVIRVWCYVAPNRKVFRRTLSYLSYMVSTCLAAPLLPSADVVVSTSPQFFCGLAGYVVSRVKRAPWVLEIRDLWPQAIQAVGAIQNRPVISALEKIEGWAYRKADTVITVTQAFRRHIESRGAQPGSVAVVTNGVNLELFSTPRRDPALERELGLGGKFVVGYFGTLGMAHHLETVIEAARLLREEPEISFLIVGDGAERASLERLRESYGLTNVLMLAQQPRERMPAFWGLCDVALAHMRRSPLFTTMIPAKMFEAMAMERPIILGFEGESREIVEEAGCGIAVEPENPAALADAVRRLAADRPLARQMGRRGRQVVTARYDRSRLAGELLAVLQQAVGTRGRRVRSSC
jgi:glycosyltransferase involved in cell wall biosynthesis